jgi:pullulanase/glycogen debranching enzyme
VIIDHLTSLGVTAIELMPVHHFANDSTLIDKGLSNYWGYNMIGFFAPDPKYASNTTPGDSFVLCFNAHHEPIEFTLPPEELGASWLLMIDTTLESGVPENDTAVKIDGSIKVSPRSVMLLKAAAPGQR